MKIQRTLTGSCAALLLVVGIVPARAQDAVAPVAAAQPEAVKLSAAQIDELLGPIALYPDPLIAQILPATTYPADIVIAARMTAKGATPAELDAQGWDSSVRAIAHYPAILKLLDERLAWTQSVGAAFLQQPDDVMDSIQRLRARARAMGHLNDTPEQKVLVEEAEPQTTVIRIVPATTEVVYVPTYDPQIVYVRPYTPTIIGSPWLSFGVGFAIGTWLDLDCDWYGRRCYYPSWTWSTCHYSSWYAYPRYHSFWGGPSWCGPGFSVGWHSGWGHHGHHRHHDHHHFDHGGDHGGDHGRGHGRTSDMSRRSDDGRANAAGPGGRGRTDDRVWSRDASRPSLHAGSQHVSRGSEMYKRSRSGDVGNRLEASNTRPQMRSADMIRRDLASRSINSPTRLDRSGTPLVNPRTGDTVRRDTADRSRGVTRPDTRTSPGERVTASPDGLRRSTSPGVRTLPDTVKRPETTVRTTPRARSSGLTVPNDMPRVRTTSPGSRSVSPATRGTSPQRAAPAPQRSGRQGLQRSSSGGSAGAGRSGGSPRATAPSSGSRPSVQRSSPSRGSAPARSSPSRSSGGSGGGGSTGNRRSK